MFKNPSNGIFSSPNYFKTHLLIHQGFPIFQNTEFFETFRSFVDFPNRCGLNVFLAMLTYVNVFSRISFFFLKYSYGIDFFNILNVINSLFWWSFSNRKNHNTLRVLRNKSCVRGRLKHLLMIATVFDSMTRVEIS